MSKSTDKSVAKLDTLMKYYLRGMKDAYECALHATLDNKDDNPTIDDVIDMLKHGIELSERGLKKYEGKEDTENDKTETGS